MVDFVNQLGVCVSELNPVEMIFKLVMALKKSAKHKVENTNKIECPSPMHVQVLKLIGANKEITANQISIDLMRDKAQVTRLLNTLTEEGLINKKANPNDKRSQLIICTDTGWTLYQRFTEIDRYILEQLSEGLTQEELWEFQRLAEKMLVNLEALSEKAARNASITVDKKTTDVGLLNAGTRDRA